MKRLLTLTYALFIAVMVLSGCEKFSKDDTPDFKIVVTGKEYETGNDLNETFTLEDIDSYIVICQPEDIKSSRGFATIQFGKKADFTKTHKDIMFSFYTNDELILEAKQISLVSSAIYREMFTIVPQGQFVCDLQFECFADHLQDPSKVSQINQSQIDAVKKLNAVLEKCLNDK